MFPNNEILPLGGVPLFTNNEGRAAPTCPEQRRLTFARMNFNIEKMNRNKWLISALILWQSCGMMMAQKAPKWTEKARRAVFTIEATDKSGNVTHGTGFFVGDQGEAVSNYTLFIGAERATVTDADGGRLPVVCILGADDLYDVIRFRVKAPKKVSGLKPAEAMPAVGDRAYLVPAKAAKGVGPAAAAISEVTKVKERYGYYCVNMPLTREQVSAPLLNEAGEVFALAQADAAGKGRTYGIGVPYIMDLRPAATDVLNKVYSSIGIRTAWADTPDEALVALMLYAAQQDAHAYLATLDDFIATFPDVPDGYLSRASHYVYQRRKLSDVGDELQLLARAEADLDAAVKRFGSNLAEGYYNRAKLIYGIAAADSTLTAEGWTMDRAADWIAKAVAADDRPLYRQLEADIAFFRGDYPKAAADYALVNQSPGASASSFYMAAKTEEQLEKPDTVRMFMLMDSAITRATAINPTDAATYLMDAVDMRMRMGRFAEAVKDYDRYYALTGGEVLPRFYYYREQAKFRAGDMDGALADIRLALAGDSTNVLYLAEEGSIYLRKQDLAKAQQSLQRCVTLAPDFAPAHRLLGLCLVRSGKKAEGCRAFERAKELGDPVVERLMKQHCQ